MEIEDPPVKMEDTPAASDSTTITTTVTTETTTATTPATTTTTAPPADTMSETVAALCTKKNDNLLKVDTTCQYSTEKVLRKEIQKKRKQGLGKEIEWHADPTAPARLEDVLPGLARIGKNPSSTMAFFSFDNEKARDCAKKFLVQMKGKKSRMWEAVEGTSGDSKYFENKARENISQKRKAEANEDGSNKRRKMDSIHDFIEPLHEMPYPDQLKQKTANLTKTLQDMRWTISAAHSRERHPEPTWLPATEEACPFEGIRPSPTLSGYRNKVEFTCGFGKDQTPCVGFLFGKTYDACGWIERPYDAKIVSARAKVMAKTFENYMSETGLAPYDKMKKEGVWRALLVREGVDHLTAKAVMLVDVQVNLDIASTEFASIASAITEVFSPFLPSEGESEERPFLGSLSLSQFTVHNNMCPSDAPSKVLLGTECIEDVAMGKRFKVSPRSFFQVNSRGNDVLLTAIAEYANLNKDTILVDLCCGTGTIGLSLADKVAKVIGIDMVASAIEDSKLNAEKNGITNAEYHCGKAEDVVHKVLAAYKENPNIVAIVDPPRNGLHNKVLRFLRECGGLTRFVYVSCKQSSLVENCDTLCKAASGKLNSEPFRPVKSLGVDLFPHCDQQEMVVLFERVEKEKEEKEEKPAEKKPEEEAK